MITNKLEINPSTPSGSEAEIDRQRRVAHEAKLIAEADAEIAAGLFVSEEEVDAWIDSLDTENELPVPSPHRP
jgi:predicted transcriptional regulator